jgi:hypothetical protein
VSYQGSHCFIHGENLLPFLEDAYVRLHGKVQGPVVCSYEHNNEHSGCIKGTKFPDKLREYYPLKRTKPHGLGGT